METEQVAKVRSYLEGIVKERGSKAFGEQGFFDFIPQKKLVNAKSALKIPETEELFLLLDDTALGSAKEGLALTSWGVRYKTVDGEWELSWNDIFSTYKIVVLSSGNKRTLALRNGTDEEYTVEKVLKFYIIDIDVLLLRDILKKVASIAGGNETAETTTPVRQAAIQLPEEKKPAVEEGGPGEIEFSKQIRILALYVGDRVTKVALESTRLTVNSQWVWGKPKGKAKEYSVEYKDIEKVELKTGFSKSSIIGSIVCLIITIVSLGMAGGILIAIPVFLFIGFGKYIIITCKNKLKISFMTGKLDGQQREEFVYRLNKKLG
jgi:hypothetical protein